MPPIQYWCFSNRNVSNNLRSPVVLRSFLRIADVHSINNKPVVMFTFYYVDNTREHNKQLQYDKIYISYLMNKNTNLILEHTLVFLLFFLFFYPLPTQFQERESERERERERQRERERARASSDPDQPCRLRQNIDFHYIYI